MIAIRPPCADEKEAWLPLWQGYLDFYKEALPSAITDLTWQRLHDSCEPIHALAAYDQGRMIGIAHYLYHLSSWAKVSYCYLEDLFVAEDVRGKGVARALITAVREEAKQVGADRIYWVTAEGNKIARAIYDQMAEKTDYVQYRMGL